MSIVVNTGVFGQWPWVVAEGQQFEFLEEVQKELVGAVQQLLRGWVGQPRRQSVGQLRVELLVSHEPSIDPF